MGSNSILFYRGKSNESAFLQIHTAFSENSPCEFFKTRRVLKNSRRVLGKTRREFLFESVKMIFYGWKAVLCCVFACEIYTEIRLSLIKK